MKKYLIASVLSIITCTSAISAMASEPIKAMNPQTLAQMNEEQKEATLIQVKERLLELKKIDPSTLSNEEKLAIKAEKKNAKAIAKGLNSRVSISLGTIIIAVLLIIIIF